MRLKRLEIHGYKSFATKTVFDFDAGITAIVGPNGSGKSNIMDALRWVMGETATRQMRARRLEDVIFSGSERRAPAGLAEVRLVLDNEGGWLPIDFSEVVVTRRVHRSGDSEFLINQNKVRLREIQALFQGGGLGQQSYALMGQGLVDDVLRVKPEERRALIEEVADVRRHRRKMESARRERQQAHENLERAQLLVEEIEPRLRRLERQAKRARQHAELQAELRAALRRYYGREWRRLQRELAASRATDEQRRAERDAALGRMNEAETALSQWEEAIRVARVALEAADAEQRQRAEQLRELEHEQALGRQRETLLKQRLGELRADLATLDAGEDEPAHASSLDQPRPDQDSQGSADSGSVDSAPADPAATAEQEATVAREALATAEAALAAAEQELETLQRREHEANESRQRLESAQADAERDAARIKVQREALSVAAGPREQRLATFRETLSQAEHAAEAGAAAAAAAGTALTEAQTRRADRSQRFYAAEAYLRQLEASRAERDRALARARDRLQLLRDLQAESEGMQQGLRALFGSRGVPRGDEDSGIPGVVGVVRHIVQAPRGLERAIEAALEDYLDAVVFETIDEALQTVRVLLSERAGRIVTLPLDQLKHRPPLAIQRERGVLGVAATLAKCDSQHRELVDTLLGRTIVVEDTETARAMLKRSLGAVVTSDGQLFRANGALLGGQVAEAGAFKRENELQALPAEIEKLERSLAEAGDVTARRGELETIEAELRQAEREGEEASSARVAAQEEAAARRADVVRLGADQAALKRETEAAVARLAELEQQTSAAGEALEAQRTAQAESETARPDVATLSAAREQRQTRAAAAGAAAVQWRALEGEHEALAEALRLRQAALARARAQRETRLGQIAELERELATLAAAVGEREGQLSQARASSETVDDGAGPEAQAVAGLAGQERERRNAAQTSRRTLLEAERALVVAEAAAREAEVAEARLQEQMTADEISTDDQGLGGAALTTANTAESTATAGPPNVATTATSTGSGQGDDQAGGHGNGNGNDSDNGSGNGVGGPALAGNGNGAASITNDAVTDSPAETPEETSEETSEESPAESIESLRESIEALRGRLRWLGQVNPDAAAEHAEARERYDFLSGQIDDLEGAEQRMLQAEADLGELIRSRFSTVFETVDRHFQRYFQTMFQGGTARLVLTDEGDDEAGGVDVIARPPGKRVNDLAMLSGGERSLTAIALLFAMLEANPAPFSVLDEVDAALDEANVGRFVDALKQLTGHSQFVLITHNRRTIEQADNIYGITMGDDSVSRVLSVRLADVELAGA